MHFKQSTKARSLSAASLVNMTPGSAAQPHLGQAWLANLTKRSAALFVVILFVLAAPFAQAQFRASLRGTVADPSGAVIPGATVTLVNKETNETKTSVSDGAGIYTFNALPAGNFRINAEKAGFKKQEIAQVVLIPDQPNALDIKMEIGDALQTVTVNGSQAPLLDTDTATLSATINSNEIQHLPSYNRDVFQLAQLTPGVFGDAAQGSGGGSNTNPGNQGPGGSGSSSAGIFQTENGPQIQARGGQYETNGVTVDGISTVSAVWGGTSVITPSEDSVADMKIVSNSYDAEVGRFSGGQIQVTSKSGSNSVHGSAFIKGSRPGLNAYQRWNGVGSNQAGTPATRGVNRDDTDTNNYGGSLGGPIWKNRVFAFFNLRGQSSIQQHHRTGLVSDTPIHEHGSCLGQHCSTIPRLSRGRRCLDRAGRANLRQHWTDRG